MCWQLDPTEGPGRVRRRMMRAPLTIPPRLILSDTPGGSREREEVEKQASCKNQAVGL